MATNDTESECYFDHFETDLNPCSVESLPQAIQIGDDGGRFWPVVTSCYQLVEEAGTRKGKMELFLVPTDGSPSTEPNVNKKDSGKEDEKEERRGNVDRRCQYRLGIPTTIDADGTGVLDGKWFPKLKPNDGPTDPASTATSSTDSNGQQGEWLFATARSSGQVCIHSARLAVSSSSTSSPSSTISSNDEGKDVDNDGWKGNSGFTMKQAAISDPLDGDPLCLALQWNRVGSRIVSSYSNGQVAIHSVTVEQHSVGTNNDEGRKENDTQHVRITTDTAWSAHTLFRSMPAEVWTTCFTGTDDCLVASGGDDGKLKFWDERALMQPVQTLQTFGAGVTVLSPHPRNEHLVACGSYDETVAIYDVRNMAVTLQTHTDPIGGGVWRIQWHPTDDDKMLIAAMHGGCRVASLRTNDHNDNGVEGRCDSHRIVIEKEFTKHKSMAYGADWLVDRQTQLAASCSFYDRALYLWDTESTE